MFGKLRKCIDILLPMQIELYEKTKKINLHNANIREFTRRFHSFNVKGKLRLVSQRRTAV